MKQLPAMLALTFLDPFCLQVLSHGPSSWPIDEYDDAAGSPRQRSSAAPGGVSMAQLPLSQQSLNMAFHVLDKDRDGLISAAEAYKMVAFYLVRLAQLSAAPSPLAAALSAKQCLCSTVYMLKLPNLDSNVCGNGAAALD
jgi:hypothetical protein